MKTRDALYLGGAVLLAATLIAQSANAQLILQIVMVITSAVLLVLGFRKDQKSGVCVNPKYRKLRVFGVTLSVAIVFGGLGFTVGRILYHVIN